MDLKRQASRGALWVFVEQFSSQMIAFVINLVLARILVPSDFGTIALFGVVMSVAAVLINGGMTSSLVRSQKLESTDFSTVFWFNVVTSLVLYVAVYLISPFVAAFYKMSILSPLIRVYSIILIIDSFVSVQIVRFEKELDFKTTFKIKLPSLLVGGVSGIFFAFCGFGVWSLVYSALIRNLVSTVQYWFYSDWRPQFTFDKQKFRYHFGFGARMTISALLDVIFNNLYTIIIGKKFSATQLGYYDRADSLKQLPVNNIAMTLIRVSYPLFAKISNDDERLRQAYQQMLKLVIYGIAPMVTLMIITAEPLIRFLLTDKWLPSVPYFKILCLAGLLYPIHAYNLNILQVKGRSDLFLKLEVLKKIMIILVVACVMPFGMLGLVWGQVVVSVAALFLNTYYTGKFLKYSLIQQISDLLPSIAVAALLGLILYTLDCLVTSVYTDLTRLLILCIFYISLYVGLTYFLKFSELKLIKDLIRKR